MFRFSNLSPRTHRPFLFVIPSEAGFPTSPLSPATTYVVLLKENHMQLTEAASLDRKSGGAEGSAVPRTFRGNVFRGSVVGRSGFLHRLRGRPLGVLDGRLRLRTLFQKID
jgi:hypothetical protein